MVFLRYVEQSHPPVVGADIVEGLHPFAGVIDQLRKRESLVVEEQRLVKVSLVAKSLSLIAQRYQTVDEIVVLHHQQALYVCRKPRQAP